MYQCNALPNWERLHVIHLCSIVLEHGEGVVNGQEPFRPIEAFTFTSSKCLYLSLQDDLQLFSDLLAVKYLSCPLHCLQKQNFPGNPISRIRTVTHKKCEKIPVISLSSSSCLSFVDTTSCPSLLKA